MKQLHIFTVQPNEWYFAWQMRIFLANLRKYGLSDRARILVFCPEDRLGWGPHFSWEQLEKDFPETKFFYILDTYKIMSGHIRAYDYIPLLRPHCLQRHFEEFPELAKDAIYYADSDTCFTTDPLFLKDERMTNDQDYMSYTGNRHIKYNYQNTDYLDGKVNDVKEGMKDAYIAENVPEKLMNIFGLHRDLFDKNAQNFGGCQYLIKNVDSTFWTSVYNGCIHVKRTLKDVNRRLFENEDKGIQSWCADLYSMQMNLWRIGRDTQTPEWMDFAWATDPIKDWDRCNIYHDAGASSRPVKEGHFLFNKREARYLHNWVSPFLEDLSWVSNEYCSHNYMNELSEAKKTSSSSIY